MHESRGSELHDGLGSRTCSDSNKEHRFDGAGLQYFIKFRMTVQNISVCHFNILLFNPLISIPNKCTPEAASGMPESGRYS